MIVSDILHSRNRSFVEGFSSGELPMRPKLSLLVLTCMDARVDPARIFGLELGDAVVLRNAGGRVTRGSLVDLGIVGYLSATSPGAQPGRPELVIMHHTDCGTARLADPDVQSVLSQRLGLESSEIAAMAVTDPQDTVRQDVAKVMSIPGMSEMIDVSGYVYDVQTGRATPVEPAN